MSDNISYIDKHRKKPKLNMGTIVFGLIFIYIFATVLIYLTKDKTSIYEVREGSLYRDTAYTGIIKRDEQVINTEVPGFVNYLAPEGSQVGVKTRVYALSDSELSFASNETDEQIGFTEEESATYYEKIHNMSAQFDPSKFDEVYVLKDAIASAMENKSSMSRSVQIDTMLSSGRDDLQVFNAPLFGLVAYSIDGYEGVDAKDFTKEDISKKNYKRTNLSTNSKVQVGDPLYKLITDDLWTVAINLDEETAKELKDRQSVLVNFPKDDTKVTAGLEIEEKEGEYFGYLSFDQGMVRYFKDRFIDLELVLENVYGYKIPKTSVVKKDFYAVPEDFITYGGNTNTQGVLIENGTDNPVFTPVTIYGRNSDEGLVYLNKDVFEKTSKLLIQTDSNASFRLEAVESVDGVYNINKGYAVFKRVEILSKNDDYYIVKKGSEYGLSNYDHIALDGAKIKENDVVF